MVESAIYEKTTMMTEVISIPSKTPSYAAPQRFLIILVWTSVSVPQ